MNSDIIYFNGNKFTVLPLGEDAKIYPNLESLYNLYLDICKLIDRMESGKVKLGE
jgi:hypothetical protein